MSVGKLKPLNPDAVIRPTKVYISSTTGHKLSILECCNLLIRNDKSYIVNSLSLIVERLSWV